MCRKGDISKTFTGAPRTLDRNVSGHWGHSVIWEGWGALSAAEVTSAPLALIGRRPGVASSACGRRVGVRWVVLPDTK